MLDDELKVVAIAAFKALVTLRKVNTPTTSMELLTGVITTRMPPELLPNSPTPKFRLTDLSRFERIIEDLANTWADGIISFSRDEASGQMTIWELGLQSLTPGTQLRLDVGSQSTVQSGSGKFSGLVSRKRKRVIDEDADSAAGDDETLLEEEDAVSASGSPLANLSAEMREVYNILQKSTAKGRLLAEQFRSREENFDPICSHITKDDCAKARRAACVDQFHNGASGSTPPGSICDRVHFRPLIRPHTDVTLGHCSYLNTCYSEPTYSQSPSIPPFPGSTHSHGMLPPNLRGPVSLPSGLGAGGRGKEKAPCRYLHYEIDWDGGDGGWKRERRPKKKIHRLGIGLGPTGKISAMQLPPQWINCDLRTFDYSTLGKFHVIMADPPWDIHMSLPYGTLTDDEMRKMPIPTLQDEGFLFLWVTGRAMEVGRECMRVWGYTRIDEVVWVKTNQLQRVIRTGRTGHWLNHTKEHMLVGVKTVLDANGNLKFPSWANRALDTDVIVSEVRETSRKPEEAYGLIERLCPGGRKVEIFGRKHNVRPGWLTLGNQLGPDQIYEEDLALRVKAK
ncbi:MT-A70-domain-containing protein [Gymnopilus junonius]|uniref:mRNA m(6)A methyltransferase n=1 Tax=Gymnopilus junonius TaxID=109634 RepID=A0A9P5NNX1_GYMJU|nr:MT-A70-domain-containing protein [Gymnopilus junonius]